ncbi:MAG: hypothetical protein ACREDL_25720 [Bradyrhizobium sp.]
MGSSHPRKSRHASKRHASRPSQCKPARTLPDLHDMLGRFSDALTLLETVARALDAAECDMEPAAIGAGIAVLQQTVQALQAVYDEFDTAIISKK